MITTSYSATATERVLPRLALDFTTGVLDPRVTVARALNTATRINSAGLIESVNANLPRFDYNPITLAPKGLLIEEQRTNLLLQSEALDNASWAIGATTVTANAAVAPDGNSTADKIIATTADVRHLKNQLINLTSGVSYTLTFYVKAAEYSKVYFADGQNGRYACSFDLEAGTAGTPTGSYTSKSASITNAGNGWYRCQLIFTATTTESSRPSVIGYPNSGVTLDNFGARYIGDDISGIFAWGAQTEAGAFPTSYIPTTTTSLTRNADVVSMTGTNFSDWYNASEGTFAVWFDTAAASAGAAIWVLVATDNSLTERVAIGATPTIPRGYVYAAGSAQADMYNGTVVNNTQKKCAISYKQNSFAFSTDGASPATDVSGVTPTLTQMFIGKYSTTYLSGHVAKVLYWPQRVTNSENQAFSK